MPVARDSRKILVVDDVPQVVDTLRDMLRHLGHKVDSAVGAKAALEKFQSGKYDLVITDYSMPEMNGAELAGALKKQAPQQIVVLLTAYAFSIAADSKEPPPVDLILTKPISLTELQGAVARLFEKPAAA